jgi:uncharacterized protein involved in exopolysaccharide biosynthesis
MAQQVIQPEIQPALGAVEPQRDGLDLLDVLLIFARRKWMLLAFTAVGALALLLYALTRVHLYEANSTILPPQEQQSSSALLGQLSMLGGFGGASKTPSDLYVSLLQSRNVREHVVRENHLEQVYHASKVEDAAGLLGVRTKVSGDKTGLITITVRDTDAKRAAALANAYAVALFELNSTLAISQASQRRLFFDQQLQQEKDHLADAEIALKKVEEQTGVIQLSGQTSTIIGQLAQLRANITSHQVQLAALRSSSTDENPEVVRVRSELSGLEQQLRELQGQQKVKSSDDIGLSTTQVPGVGLEYIRKEREVQYHQTLFDLLARQLEAARIDEAKAAPIVQVLDTAEVPNRIAYPKTLMLTILGAAVGFILGAAWCVVLYLYHYVEEEPMLHKKMWAVKSALVGRRW